MVVAGARPNFMKIASITNAIDSYNLSNNSPRIQRVLVHTGQHYGEQMSKAFFKDLEIPQPRRPRGGFCFARPADSRDHETIRGSSLERVTGRSTSGGRRKLNRGLFASCIEDQLLVSRFEQD